CPGGPATKPGDDPALREWMNHRGVYAANGVVMTIILRSRQAADDVPDLFIFGLPGSFAGYEKGYSCDLQSEPARDGTGRVDKHNRFTWAILKGRTRSHKGTVQLRDNSPLSRPDINFKYFDEAFEDDPAKKDEWK